MSCNASKVTTYVFAQFTPHTENPLSVERKQRLRAQISIKSDFSERQTMNSSVERGGLLSICGIPGREVKKVSLRIRLFYGRPP